MNNFPFLISKFRKYINEDKSLNIAEMWHELSPLKDFVNNTPRFFNICKLARLVLALPNSNGNKIGDKALNSVAVIRSSFQDNNINCISHKVESKHFELHNYKNLYEKKMNTAIKLSFFK
ncbi:protein FAM200B-like [Aphis craccivora]|uniref:Protein FAM200B-like n=1 Tax=Aphis craccivora TaxID=307492 RepID=A0A6G0Y6G1_APHCR|nr:protein FAM200B-like [Aphis craccivora]